MLLGCATRAMQKRVLEMLPLQFFVCWWCKKMLFLTVDASQNAINVHCDGKLSMLCWTIHLEQEKLVMYLRNVTSYNRLQHLSMQQRCWPAHSNNSVA